MLEVKFKKISKDVPDPIKGTDGAAAYDLTVRSWEYDLTHKVWKYYTGIALELPPNYAAFVFARSGVYKVPARLANGVGVIDSDYRGEIMAMFDGKADDIPYDITDRVVQIVIMPVPEIKFVEVDELSETKRGIGGFGSTGR